MEFFTFLCTVLGFLSRVLSTACVLAVVFFLWRAIQDGFSFSTWMRSMKKGLQSFSRFMLGNLLLPALIVALVSTLISSTVLHQLIGIHNLELKPDGTYCFYVEAHRTGSSTYVLPAQIRVFNDVDKGESEYFIEKVYFSNGGWLDADDGESDAIGEPSYFYDDDDEWSLTLLNQHAYSPYVTETNNANWLNITILLIQTISISLLLYAWCCKDSFGEN